MIHTRPFTSKDRVAYQINGKTTMSKEKKMNKKDSQSSFSSSSSGVESSTLADLGPGSGPFLETGHFGPEGP